MWAWLKDGAIFLIFLEKNVPALITCDFTLYIHTDQDRHENSNQFTNTIKAISLGLSVNEPSVFNENLQEIVHTKVKRYESLGLTLISACIDKN